MNENPTSPNWARPDAVAELLSAHPEVEPAAADALCELLVAASAPATAGELRGEAAAVAAFRLACQPMATDPRSRPSMNHRIARLLTVKAAAITVALTATGGVALAASSGTLPGTGSGTVPGGTSALVPAPTHKPAPRGDESQDSDTGGVKRFAGLCHAALQADLLHHPDLAAKNPDFARLLAAAGGAAQLPSFCAHVAGMPIVTTPGSPPTVGQSCDDQGENDDNQADEQGDEQGDGNNQKPATARGDEQGDESNQKPDAAQCQDHSDDRGVKGGEHGRPTQPPGWAHKMVPGTHHDNGKHLGWTKGRGNPHGGRQADENASGGQSDN